jgi:hypothetical protein
VRLMSFSAGVYKPMNQQQLEQNHNKLSNPDLSKLPTVNGDRVTFSGKWGKSDETDRRIGQSLLAGSKYAGDKYIAPNAGHYGPEFIVRAERGWHKATSALLTGSTKNRKHGILERTWYSNNKK